MPDILSPATLLAPTEPPVNLPGGNQQPQPKPGVCLVRDEAIIPQHRLHHLEVARRRLPVTDVDRHFLDLEADRAFAFLAIENPHLVTNDPTWQPGVTA